MSSFFHGLVDIGLFLTFGLPVLIGGVMLLLGGFNEGMPFSWKGRINRRSFLVNMILTYAILFVSIFLFTFKGSALNILSLLLLVAAILRAASLFARRLHDFGLSGVIGLVYLLINWFLGESETVKVISAIAQLVFLFYPGNDYYNQYGDIPEKKISF